MNNSYFLLFILLIFPSFNYFLSSLFANGFECFVCNSDSNDDDTKPCIGKIEECPIGPSGTQSCSTLLYFSKRENSGLPHMRKFCTSPGIQLGLALEKYQLNIKNKIGLCQSVEQWLIYQIDQQQQYSQFNLKNSHFIKNQKILSNTKRRKIFNEQKLEFSERRKRNNNNRDNGSPSPPQSHSSTILCICNKSLCNEGDFEQILENSQISDIKVKNNKFNIIEENEEEKLKII